MYDGDRTSGRREWTLTRATCRSPLRSRLDQFPGFWRSSRIFKKVTGDDYDREFGERQSSKRRGAQFEQNAYAGDARLLREAFAGYLGKNADDVVVRNLYDDHPGTKDDARIARLRTTRKILADGHTGQSVPDIILQPQLLLPTNEGLRPYFFIAPDLLVWSPEHGVYAPGDLKSFVVRENEVTPGDLARVRLQLGAQVLALRHEYHRLDQSIVMPAKGMLLFSKPNGLMPHAPRIEDVAGGVEAVRIGISAFLRHRQRIQDLSAGADPHTVVPDLQPHFQDSCLNSCVMAQWCRQRIAGKAADLGDAAGEALGNIDVQRAIDLMIGTIDPANDQERLIAHELQELAARHSHERAA